MMENSSYKKAFLLAVGIHFFLGFALFFESTVKNPVLTKDTVNMPGSIQPVDMAATQEIVKAEQVDSKALQQAVNQLKEQKLKEKQAEINRQAALNKQAAIARQNRIKEQEKLEKLKKEADALAIARKKQAEEEKKRLQAMAEEKIKETKRLNELKKLQQQESDKLAALQKKHAEDKAKADKAIADKITADKALAEKQRQAAERAEAQADAANRARMAGEVDKYKALILNAIGRQWILPDKADRGLSSQFRIRLAPGGAVMEVSLTRSSGDPILDRSAQTAIYKASPLPVPEDPAMFNMFRDINLTVRPEQVRG